jgi:hypothetical protein
MSVKCRGLDPAIRGPSGRKIENRLFIIPIDHSPMRTALRLLPGRRQVARLTYTNIDSMADHNPAWDREPIPDVRIPVPVKLQSTRSTFLGAITVAGGRLKPLVIIARETVETELYENGLTPERVMCAKQENAFITRELFAQWANQVLFPYFAGARASLGYDGHGVVLLDGCSARVGDLIEGECLWHGIEYIFLPPHSSGQVQPMDLGIFAVQEMEAARSPPHVGLNPQSRKIIKMVDGYFRATCPDNVIGAFRRAVNARILTLEQRSWSGRPDSVSIQIFTGFGRRGRNPVSRSLSCHFTQTRIKSVPRIEFAPP